MKEINITKLDRKRFDVLAGQARSPAAAYMSQELEWYSNEDESIIGVLLLDTIDYDYVAVALGRDEGGRFRAFAVEASHPTPDAAITWLIGTIKWHTGMGTRVFPQGDEITGTDLFTPVVPIEKMHPYFSRLSSDSAFTPAKSVINNLMPHHIDIDGNFVEQFQSTGFDSRLWELYLYAYFSEEQLFFERQYSAPDFVVKKYGKTVAIEAVIVGRKQNNPASYFKAFDTLQREIDVIEEHKNAMPIRFGSPLYSKLNKKYWELEQVNGHPLIFAIADFHDDMSMLWSSTALTNYLYGVRQEFYYDENNQLIITPIRIESHKVEGKKIPSGFFFQDNSEYVSAVLFSSSGTISKFNRLGKQAGLGDKNILMIRQGTCHDHDPNASLPKMFRYIVDEKCNETWGEGLSMFHNPSAIHPVPIELFPSIAHHRFENGQIISQLPEFHPYSSLTVNVRFVNK